MRLGKIPENVLKRSILKQIKTKREEVKNGAGIGEDCAVFAFEGQHCAVSMGPVLYGKGESPKYAIIKAVNNLAAGGSRPVGIMLTALFPENIQEADVKKMMAEAEETCAKFQIQLAGGHTEISDAVKKPVFIATGIGMPETGEDGKAAGISTKGAKPGQEIVITKWIGLEGTVILAKERKEELLTKYPLHLIEEAESFEQYLSVLPEAAAAAKSGAFVMHDASEGGIFGALWELAESSGVGLEIDFKKLPVKQETIEVCEFFDLNPYELVSGGCLLIVTDRGLDLVRTLEKKGIPAVVAGKITDNHDRVVIKDGERRFLELPKSDEIYKLKF